MTSVLRDKIFISTRPKDASEDLTDILTGMGARVVELPMIEIKANNLSEEGIRYLKKTGQFQWIIFTSANGVNHFFKKFKEITGSYYLQPAIQFAVIGSKTEQVLQEYGYKASFINPGSTAEEFAPSFKHHISKEESKPNILLPFGNLARTVIQDQLKDIATCIRINVYKTEIPKQTDQEIIKQIASDHYDLIIFTSPSGVRNFVKINPDLHTRKIRTACIGAITEREAHINGFETIVTAQRSTTEGLVESIINYYISKK
ncbi:MAG TPA: uroporphyrinogen-III synthase [Mariniphaga sp.]|nr:uroporphyrinogen-III synthase [Mariniphaga sp.]